MGTAVFDASEQTLANLSHLEEIFIRRWSGLRPRISAGDVTGAAAVRARTEVMNTCRHFPVLDPLLPIDLLPADWPRSRARDVCVAVYDGLAQPAQQHVRSVAARSADGPHHHVSAHTLPRTRTEAFSHGRNVS